MQYTRHAEFFRQQLEFPWFSRYSLANILEISEEQVLELRFAEKWTGREWIAYLPGPGRRTGADRLYHALTMSYETRFALVAGMTSLLEEAKGPLLGDADWEADRHCELYPGVKHEVLRAALYRARQFQYVRSAAHELHLTDDDAIAAVSKGFHISPAVLGGIRDTLDRPVRGAFLDMDASLRFHALLVYCGKLRKAKLFPEFSPEMKRVA